MASRSDVFGEDRRPDARVDAVVSFVVRDWVKQLGALGVDPGTQRFAEYLEVYEESIARRVVARLRRDAP